MINVVSNCGACMETRNYQAREELIPHDVPSIFEHPSMGESGDCYNMHAKNLPSLNDRQSVRVRNGESWSVKGL